MTANAETVSFEIPSDLLASLKMGPNTLGQQIRVLAAVTYFKEKKLSLGKAAQLAGLNRLVFMDVLTDQGLVMFDFDEAELDAELAGLENLTHDR
jgi:predicted HTH domain antitoxin